MLLYFVMFTRNYWESCQMQNLFRVLSLSRGPFTCFLHESHFPHGARRYATMLDLYNKWSGRFKDADIPEPDESSGYITAHLLGYKTVSHPLVFLNCPPFWCVINCSFLACLMNTWWSLLAKRRRTCSVKWDINVCKECQYSIYLESGILLELIWKCVRLCSFPGLKLRFVYHHDEFLAWFSSSALDPVVGFAPIL